MKFLKENTLLMVFIFIGVGTFTTLAILSSSVSTELEEISKDISREKGKQESTLEELSVFQNLEFDYSQALGRTHNFGRCGKKTIRILEEDPKSKRESYAEVGG